MNRLILFLITLIGGCVAMKFAWPWWSIAVIALVVGALIIVRRRAGFWFAFLAGLFSWGGYATYLEITNDGILAERMANLFQLGNGWLVVLITAFWGALTAGLGGWTGVNLRKALRF